MNYLWGLENPTWYNIWKSIEVEGLQVSQFGIKGEEFRPNLLKILIDLTGMPDAEFVGDISTSVTLNKVAFVYGQTSLLWR